MSYRPEVEVDGVFYPNALRFELEEEARLYAADLYSRWTLTTAFRAVKSDDPVNHEWIGGLLVRIEEPEPPAPSTDREVGGVA